MSVRPAWFARRAGAAYDLVRANNPTWDDTLLSVWMPVLHRYRVDASSSPLWSLLPKDAVFAARLRAVSARRFLEVTP